MTQRIKYDAHAPHGAILAEAVASLIAARDKIGRVLDAVQAMSYGSDTAAVVAELGLGSDQDAADLQYLLTSMHDTLTNSAAHQFTDRLDQG